MNERFSPGDRVEHDAFGPGIVGEVDPDPSRARWNRRTGITHGKIDVRFDDPAVGMVKLKIPLPLLRNTSIGPSGKNSGTPDEASGTPEEPSRDEETPSTDDFRDENERVVPLDREIDWSINQRAHIEAAPEERLLVDAGPGTGKTAVACARVAHLVDCGVAPANVWLLSFTRTAVQEIRDRIRSFAEAESAAASVKISTLDSEAWWLLAGFHAAGEDRGFPGYAENIRDAIELLSDPTDEILDYFEKIEHIVVDEAQDLVGDRADLIMAIIRLLDDSCGITVFSDEAQAIYGFTTDEDDEAGVSDVEILPVRLRNDPELHFRESRLTSIFRTDSENLRHIFTTTRDRILMNHSDPHGTYRAVFEEIADYGDGGTTEDLHRHLAGQRDSLILFRRRAEVLTESSFWLQGGVAHRIRMSGFSYRLRPWVALLLSEHTDRRLTRKEFETLWIRHVDGIDSTAPTSPKAWDLMWQHAGDPRGRSRIDLHVLRERLGRSRPPIGFFLPEVGSEGPIIGTIHASKGRESNTVVLKRPVRGPGDHPGEETRVLFVGATRAKEELRVGSGYAFWSSSISRRACRRPRKGKMPSIEIGREHDVDLYSHVLRSTSRSEFDPANRSQAWLRRRIGGPPVRLKAVKKARSKFELCVHDQQERVVGRLSKFFAQDLYDIIRELKTGGDGRVSLPAYFDYIYLIDVCSVVLPADHAMLERLAEPYCRSGVFLAPVVVGFSPLYIRKG